MNIDKMINMLLLNISKYHSVFYMDKRTYNNMKTYRSYIVTINNNKKEFKSKKELVIYLSKYKVGDTIG